MHRRSVHADVTAFEFHTPRTQLARYSVHVFLVRGAMIDLGFHAVRRDVLRLVDELRPRGALLTHWHEDHAGNVQALAARGLPLAMSADTQKRVREVDPIALYRRWTWGSMPSLRTPLTSFAPDDLALVPAPGHSSDHHVVWDAATRTLFAGDLYLGVKVRVMHPSEDPYQIVESLRMAIALEPARMFCAHRGHVENPVAQLRAKVAWLEETIGEIERRIARGMDDASIAREVLGRESFTGWISRGEYAHRNIVAAVRRNGVGVARG